MIADPDDETRALPTKKMFGSKKGGLIPLLGFVRAGGQIVPGPGRHRLVTGEGIENTLAVALAEAGTPLADISLYAAAGDLGNLTGPADPKSGFSHPELKTAKGRALRVAGPEPKPGAEGEAMALPPGVTTVVQVADGDSEPFMTTAAMERGRKRWLLLGAAEASTVWPSRANGQGGPGCGFDFCDLMGE